MGLRLDRTKIPSLLEEQGKRQDRPSLPSSFVPGSGGGGGGGEIRTPPPRARRAASVENRLAPTEEREEREREVAAVTLPGKV